MILQKKCIVNDFIMEVHRKSGINVNIRKRYNVLHTCVPINSWKKVNEVPEY